MISGGEAIGHSEIDIQTPLSEIKQGNQSRGGLSERNSLADTSL